MDYRSKTFAKMSFCQSSLLPLPLKRKSFPIRRTKGNVPIRVLNIYRLPSQVCISKQIYLLRISTNSLIIWLFQTRLQHLSSHFAAFGPIAKVTLEYQPYCKSTHSRAIVIFKHAEDATRALCYRSHQMFGSDLNVRAAKSEQQTADMEEVVESHYYACPGNGLNLLDLTDHCLWKIIEYIPVIDLPSVADTCSRLRDATITTFRIKHKRLTILADAQSDSTVKISKMFTYFGVLIRNLTISAYNSDQLARTQVLHCILHCCEPMLESLRLVHFHIDASIVARIQMVFGRTKRLILHNCTIDMDRDINLFTNAKSLIKLKISKVNNFDATTLATICLPNLELFTYNDTILDESENGAPILKSFLMTHGQLKKLNINGYLNNHYAIFPIIGQHLQQLEKLYINAKCDTLEDVQYNYFISHLCELKRLKKLKMQCRNRSPATFMANLKSTETLEHVEFSDGIFDFELTQNLIRFANLRTICLLDMDHVHLHLAQLSNTLPLIEIVIKGFCDVTDQDLVMLPDKFHRLQLIILMDTGYQLSNSTYMELVRVRKCTAVNGPLIVRNFETSQKDILCSFPHEHRKYVEFYRYTKYDNPLLYNLGLRLRDEDERPEITE